MEESVRIKVRGTVVTNRYGTLGSGDIINTDPDYARHLVEELKAADYADARAEPAEETPEPVDDEDDEDDDGAPETDEDAAAAGKPRHRAKRKTEADQ